MLLTSVYHICLHRSDSATGIYYNLPTCLEVLLSFHAIYEIHVIFLQYKYTNTLDPRAKQTNKQTKSKSRGLDPNYCKLYIINQIKVHKLSYQLSMHNSLQQALSRLIWTQKLTLVVIIESRKGS